MLDCRAWRLNKRVFCSLRCRRHEDPGGKKLGWGRGEACQVWSVECGVREACMQGVSVG